MMSKHLLEIKGANITKVIAGGSNGSIVLFDLKKGEKEFVMYIYCTWRLSNNDKVLTSANAKNIDSKSNFVKVLKLLEGSDILEINNENNRDFSIITNSEYRLDAFSDIIMDLNGCEERENWTLCNISDNICFNFTNNFEIKIEPYED